ncbi:hypothetical protein ACFQ5N_09035 [Lutibacter holmesii]|uniref:Uncharacterized protein n=1 Tax=Lutibacter holmesii TaxID=1137985 RepID=A0ABW3WQQ9_9FLAO
MAHLLHKKNIIKGLWITLGLGTLSFILYLILLVFFDNINTLFNITAHTEIIKFQTVNKPISRYNLNNASIHVTDNYNFKNIYNSFNGSLEINKNVKVEIERISQGNIIFLLESDNGTSIGNLYNSSNENIYAAKDYMLIEIKKVDSLLNNGISIVFPLSGYVELGKSVDVEILNETNPVVRTGDITMTGYSNFGSGQYFEAGNKKLYLGDCLEFENKDAIGFVAVNDSPALQVAYRIEANEAIIRKPGPKGKNSGYRISASVYDKFINDRFFQGLSMIFATLLVITSLTDFTLNIIKRKKR